MKTILRIGYRDYLLPASANVNVILKAIGDAKPCDLRMINGKYRYLPEKDAAEIEVKVVADDMVISPKDLKRLPLNASPDANGSNIEQPD